MYWGFFVPVEEGRGEFKSGCDGLDWNGMAQEMTIDLFPKFGIC